MAAVTITVLRWNGCLRETWLYAGTSEYPTLLALRKAVTMRWVQIISRKDSKPSGFENPQRLYAKHPQCKRVKIESELHGDMQRLAEMTNPLTKVKRNKSKRNSLSGKFRPARMA